MTSYHDLPADQKEQLLKFPAYISLLAAAYHNNGMDSEEKKSAIEFAHVKTYSSDPMLREFYDDVEKRIESDINELDAQLPKQKNEREIMIRAELEKLEKILRELGTDYANVMHESMRGYKEHVAHAHHSLMEYLLFPIPIKGLTY